MQKHHKSTALTISQFAQNKARGLARKATSWGVLCLVIITLVGVAFYHYKEIKRGMEAMNVGLSQTLGLGGEFIPQQIMRGAISTGNFQGFWVYDKQGNLIAKRAKLSFLNPSIPKSIRIGIESFQVIVFRKAPLSLNNEKIGFILAAYHIPVLPLLFLLLVLVGMIILTSYFLKQSIYGLASDMTKPIIEMTESVNNKKESFIENSRKWNLLEIDKLYETFKDYLKQSKEAEDSLISSAINQRVASIAYKVRHDIKASLYIAENKLNEIPSNLSHVSSTFKSIFKRISNIAEDIPKFEENPSLAFDLQLENERQDIRNCHIASVVNEIANEFATSNLAGKDIKVKTEYKKRSFHLFCKVDIIKFKRVLVNLIKNSFESIQEKGFVEISLSHDDDFLHLFVKDNGKGITESQLRKVGCPGVTFRKEKGTGLGLSSSIDNIKCWNGSLSIESQPELGTQIKISLPLEEEDLLLPTEIFIEPHTEVIVADDDPLYLDLYRKKFSNMAFKKNHVRFSFWSNIRDAKTHLIQLIKKRKNYLFLSDNDFGKQEQRGLELIKELEIIDKSILISTDGANTRLLQECKKVGIPMISKSIVQDLAVTAIG